MKIRNFLFGIAVLAAALTSCVDNAENLGTPNIELSTSEMNFDATGGEQTVSVTASRDWTAEADVDWIVVSPESGEASPNATKVTVTVLSNTGLDREADVTFSIGMVTKTLTVSQSGETGSADDLIVYSNNFDKTDAAKTNDQWQTYLDSFDGWMNATGTGIADVTYGFDRMTARTNSGNGSAGTYSDYAGSGRNYLWFGSGTPYFAVKNITLPAGKRDFTLSFGTERYEYNAEDNTFSFDEFKVYVSADAKKWVKPEFTWAAGTAPNGRWDLASSTFTVPEGTKALSVYFTASVGSSYALDDLSLVESDAAGTALDFTNGEEFEIGDNTTSGGGSTTTPPASSGKKTVAEFISAADTQNYYELTGTVSGFSATYCSFDLTDDSGKIYVYSVLDECKTQWSSKIKNGGTITIYGKYAYYEAKSQHEVVDAYIVSFTEGTAGEEPSNKPENLVKVSVAEFLAAEESTDTWYELTGEITSIDAGNAYGNLYVNDGTGEVYIYGLTNGWVGYNDKSFDSIGLKAGDTVTLGTLRGSYNGSPQGGGSSVPAYYISHVPGEGNEGGDDNTGDSGAIDADWAYTFAQGDLGSEYSAASAFTFNNVVWDFSMTGSTYLGWDSSDSARGVQMGKKAQPASSITLSTEGITGTIKQIVVNTSGANGTDAELVVKVGGADFGTAIKTTKTATDYTFAGSASGKIELTWTQTATAAVYIKSIAIVTE